MSSVTNVPRPDPESQSLPPIVDGFAKNKVSAAAKLVGEK